ncbi:pyruvate ferredoxin oxidoreductase alpha subunit [Methanomicrobium sp. W14]|uniref:transketolase C-terminal domain-containing protein n=1 Tax=Methanomicrobium sp. W14 TaxID=2817839 RepID=UPI001AE5D919|nr:transketolase C-terminal domain-containing protein [Methanomicrobium sp. W14]MBP2133789.1 pyruvate ferredoxin oxidoreductase alpha subunit [Methanomicrobium sp. W14]
MLTVSTGNKAVATAVKDAKPVVVAAYPITPQTEVVEETANYVATKQLDAHYIPVESEHSSMGACIGASATGVRTFTATSSHGLVYMCEMLHMSAGARLPIVMANANRALGPGWNIGAEHSDSMSMRDTGWLQVYVSTVQEAYDMTLMAFRIAENNNVLLPVMINLDGFLLTHITQPLETVEPGDFIPPINLPHAIDINNPGGYGTLTPSDEHFKFRYDIQRAMRDSVAVIRDTQAEFGKRFGRTYDIYEEYRTEDAEIVVIAMGTMAKEAEVAADLLRKEGIKAGCIRVRWFRPFPDLSDAVKGKDVVVIDRDCSFGYGGILANEIRAKTGCSPFSVIAGLGGQEVTYDDIAGFVRRRKAGEEFWFGVDE